MKQCNKSRLLAAFLIPFFFAASSCSTSPTGRKQFTLLPDAQMNAMGEEAFQQMKAEGKVVSDPAIVNYVTCIVKPLLEVTPGTKMSEWEVQVFNDESANAFALPGGKVGVHTGMLKVAKTDAQLAAVLGHEIGHVIAEHGNERVSQALGTQLAIAGAGILAKDSPKRDLIMGALGLGAQVGVLLPFGRTQESESDIIGQRLMAEAGFDPKGAVELWQNMKAAGGGAPPEFLSTHPSGESRIQDLQENMDDAMARLRKARAAGRNPQCERPA